MDEEEKDEHAILLNVSRRHLTAEQKVEIAKTLKARHPEWTIAKIAKMLHVREADLGGQLRSIPHLPTVEGEDGKQYPAGNEPAERKREAIRDEIKMNLQLGNLPSCKKQQVAQATGANDQTVYAQRKKKRNVLLSLLTNTALCNKRMTSEKS